MWCNFSSVIHSYFALAIFLLAVAFTFALFFTEFFLYFTAIWISNENAQRKFFAKAKRSGTQHKMPNVLPVLKCDSQEFTLLFSLHYFSNTLDAIRFVCGITNLLQIFSHACWTILTWHIRGHKCYATTYTRNNEKKTEKERHQWDTRDEVKKKAKDIKHKGRNEKYRKRSEMNLFSFFFHAFPCRCRCICVCVYLFVTPG